MNTYTQSGYADGETDNTVYDAKQQALREVRRAIAAKRYAENEVVKALEAYNILKQRSAQ
jgi:hypothetical protein